MDFIIKLPLSKEPLTETVFDSILVINDKLIKYVYLVPYKEFSNAEDLAYVFVKIVVTQYRILKEIISDRDKLFTLRF